MDILTYFKDKILPDIELFFGITKTNFEVEGDFGRLVRFEFFSKQAIGGIDIWSKNWIEINLYAIKDMELIEKYHKLLDPSDDFYNELDSFKRVIINEIYE